MKNKLLNILKKIGRSPITYIALGSLLLILIFIPEIFLAAGLSAAVTFKGVDRLVLTFFEIALSLIIMSLWVGLAVIILRFIFNVLAIIKQFLLLSSIKRALKANKRNFDIKTSLYHCGRLNFSVRGTINGRKENINIVFLHVGKRYAKYHFSDPETVEVWVKKLMAVGGRHRARLTTIGEWEQRGLLKLPKWQDGENYLIFDRKPQDVTSDERSELKFRISGDTLFKTFTIYTKDKFIEHLEKK